ncbi:MAG TPA: hypothetical protein DCY94_03360 [Firmicutes bacterium]|nr:hypothetical protein [Bacillota bacterium]
MEYSERKVDVAEQTYLTTRVFVAPILKSLYKPIVLNKSFVPKDINRGMIFAPNHRSTVDPFAIISATEGAIHWAALKRFFDAEDSIFNNSKNPFLCQLTRLMFNTLGFVPIDRETMNLDSLRIMSRYLKENRSLGIFPEGTTNKHPDQYDIGPVKPGFAVVARKGDAWIQPISILWIKDDKIENKIVINFREPFLSNKSKQEIVDLWTREVQMGINQNREVIKNLRDVADDSSVKRISLKIK